MIIILHVVLAVSGLISTILVNLSPSQLKLNVSYVLAIGTLISGSYLLIGNPSHLAPACLMGLAYFSLVTVGLLTARRKFAKAV